MFKRLLLATLLIGIAACGPVVKNGIPLAAVYAAEQQPDGPYRLQPGDQVEVHHVLDPDYSALVTVGPDGRISVPGIRQPVVASGETVTSLTDELNRLYKQANLLRDPFFSLNLRSFGSLQIFVGGEVQRPGYLELSGGNRRLLQVIVAGGGFLNSAKPNEVVVIRTLPDGKNVVFAADMTKVISGEDLSQNVPIKPLDVVYVPKSNVASFDVWIDQYIRQALPLNTSASLTLTNQSTSR